MFHLCHQLARRGLDIHLLTTQRNHTATALSFRVYPLMRNWSWTEAPRFMRVLKRCSPDAIVLVYSGWIYNDHPMITFAPTISKTILPRTHFVTQLEIDEVSHHPSLFTRAFRKGIIQWVGAQDVNYAFGTLLRDSDRIIVLSENHLMRFSEKLPGLSQKSVVIPPPPLMRICPENNGAPRKRGRQMLGVKPNDFLIAYFGYVDPTKGVETLLRAVQMLSSERSNVHLVMVGGGRGSPNAYQGKRLEVIGDYERQMCELAEHLGIAGKVTWAGGYAWDSDEASVYLRASDACVLPFDRGIALNRSSFAAAAAHGLPIVTTKGERLESPFVDRKNVMLLPPKDPMRLADAIESLISSPELREQLGVGALELAAEWFSWDKAALRTMETLKVCSTDL